MLTDTRWVRVGARSGRGGQQVNSVSAQRIESKCREWQCLISSEAMESYSRSMGGIRVSELEERRSVRNCRGPGGSHTQIFQFPSQALNCGRSPVACYSPGR
jgi:hypothetical protein